MQSSLDANQSGQENVDVARLDLLNGADIQVHQFGQLLLRQSSRIPLTAEIGTELFKLR